MMPQNENNGKGFDKIVDERARERVRSAVRTALDRLCDAANALSAHGPTRYPAHVSSELVAVLHDMTNTQLVRGREKHVLHTPGTVSEDALIARWRPIEEQRLIRELDEHEALRCKIESQKQTIEACDARIAELEAAAVAAKKPARGGRQS